MQVQVFVVDGIEKLTKPINNVTGGLIALFSFFSFRLQQWWSTVAAAAVTEIRRIEKLLF